jgi:hypothetical protein
LGRWTETVSVQPFEGGKHEENDAKLDREPYRKKPKGDRCLGSGKN